MTSQRVDITMGIHADTGQAKQSLHSLFQELNNLSVKTPIFDKDNQLDIKLKQGVEGATQLKAALQSAVDVNTGKLDLSKFSTTLNQAGLSLDSLRVKMEGLGPAGVKAFNNVCNSILATEAPVRRLNGFLGTFTQTLMNTAIWTVQSTAIHGVQKALRGAYQYAKDLNKGLTDIAIVSDLNANQLANFAREANNAAKALSTTTNEYVKGALIYYQQGLSSDEVAERTATTIKMANASGETAETISSYMTAIWNNFADGSKEIEYYADVIAYLGAKTAASNDEIAEGMKAFSAVANTVGLSYEYASSALTTLVAKTRQSASTVGNSLKTIFARLSSVNLGETLEDGVNLTKYTTALQKVGVNVIDINGNLKEMDDILDELGNRWETLNQAQKIAVAQTVGGVRQYNNLIALLDNFDYFESLTEAAEKSEGFLQSQQIEYAESWEATSKRLKASFETLYQQILNDKFFIKLTDNTAKIVNFITQMIDGLGGLKGLLPTLISLFSQLWGDKIAGGLQRSFSNLHDFLHFSEQQAAHKAMQDEAATAQRNSLQGLSDDERYKNAVAKLVEDQRVYNENAKNLSTYQQQILKADLDRRQTLLDQLATQKEQTAELEKQQNLLGLKDYTKDTLSDVGARKHHADNFIDMINVATMEQQGKTNHINPVDRKDLASNWLSAHGDKVSPEMHGLIEKYANTRTTLTQNKIFEEIKNLAKSEVDRALQESAQKMATKSNTEKTTEKTEQKAAENLENKVKTEKEITAENQKQDEVKIQINEKERQAVGYGQEIEASKQKENKLVNEITEAERHYNSEQALAAERARAVVQQTQQIAMSVQSAVMAISSVTALFTSFGALFDNLKDGDLTLGKLMGSLTGIAISALGVVRVLTRLAGPSGLLHSAAMSGGVFSKVLKILRIDAAATTVSLSSILVPMAIIIATVAAIVAIVKIYNNILHKEFEATKAQAEADKKLAEEQQALEKDTRKLTDSVRDLVNEYNELNKSGKSTFNTLQKLKEQTPELIKSYEKLAKKLGLDISGALADLERFVEVGNVEKAEEIITVLDETLSEQEVETAKLANRAAKNGVITANSGVLGNGIYTSDAKIMGWGRKAEDILSKNMGKYLERPTESSNFYRFTTHTDDMEGYREALEKTKQALIDAEQTGSPIYKKIANELDGLTTALDNQVKTSEESLQTYIKDFNNANIPSLTMEGYLGSREDLINNLVNHYEISDEEAAKVLNNHKVLGSQEKLYKSWMANLVREDDSGNKDESLVHSAAKYYDSVSDKYRGAYNQFLAGLDYSGAVEGNSLNEATLNQELSETVEAWRKANFLTEGEGRGFEIDDIEAYSNYIADIADKSKELADTLKDDSDAAVVVARSAMSLNKGVEALSKGFEEWNDILQNSSETSREYYEAMDQTKTAVADLFEVQKDFVTNDFIKKHLEEISKAAEGDEEAIESLREALADNILKNIVNAEDFEGDVNRVRSAVGDLKNWLDSNNLEIGARISLNEFNGTEQEFLKHCQELVDAAGMTAEQANAYFDAMGFETTFVTEQKPVVKTGRGTVTVTEPYGGQTIQMPDGSTFDIPSGYQTKTYPGDAYQYVDYVDAIAMETSTDGKTKVPKIESLTRKAPASMNNFSSSNKGGGKKGSGGGSKKGDKAERYHEINDKLDETSKLLKEINTYENRAYGKQKLDYMDQNIEALKRQADQYAQLNEEARQYLANDKAILEQQYQAQFNDDGTIANFDEWYNKYKDLYESGKMSDEAYDAFKEAVKNYEDSLDQVGNSWQNYIDSLNNVYDKLLEEVEYALKYQNELIDDNLELLDYMLKKLADDGYDAADAIALLSKEMGEQAEKMDNYKEAIEGVLEVAGADESQILGFLNGTIDLEDLAKQLNLTEDAIEDLRDYRSELLKLNETMRELAEKVFDELTQALDRYAEEAEKALEKTDNYADRLEHLKNVIDIIGKDALGITGELLDKLAEASYQNSLRQIEIARTALEEIRYDKAQLQKEYQDALARGEMDDELQRHYDELFDDLAKREAEAVKRLAEKEEAALQAATEVFQQHLSNIVENFESAMSGAYKTLDNLQDAFERQKKLNELFVDDYQKIHDLSKLNRDIQKSLDATDNVKAMQYLRNLQQEVNDGLKEGNKLTEYDIGFLERKYQLRLAEIALEEAQNAKSKVRMTRTSEGDWSYTYYADEADQAQAQQNYEDKLYELEEYNQNRIKAVQDEMMQELTAYRDMLAGLNVSDEERAQMLSDYYLELQDKYSGFLNKALGDGHWIEDEFDVIDHNLINDWDETVLAHTTGFETLEGYMSAYVENSQKASEDLGKAYEEWGLKWQEVLTTAGDNATDFGSQVGEESGDIIQAGKDVVSEYKDRVQEQQALWVEALSNLDKFVSEWNKKIKGMMANNEQIASGIQGLIGEYSKLEAQARRTASAMQATNDGGSTPSGGGEDKDRDKDRGTPTIPDTYELRWGLTTGQRPALRLFKNGVDTKQMKIAPLEPLEEEQDKTNKTIENTFIKELTAQGIHGSIKGGYKSSFASGGYTGEWGNSGRLALLHQKELVLNQEDTRNILQSVNMVRNISDQLLASASMSASGLGQLASAGIGAGTQFEQVVNINAEFPNAVYHDEIKQAFDDLLGRTTQFLMRK